MVPLWSPRRSRRRSPVDEPGAPIPAPVDKGTKRGPERLRDHSCRRLRASQAPGRGATAPSLLALSGGGQKGVGLLGRGRKVTVVGVEITAGGLHRGVTEDVLEHMQRNAGTGHPGRPGVTQAVPGEVGQPELRDDAVPVGGVADGRGGETFTPIGGTGLGSAVGCGSRIGGVVARTATL